MTTPATPRKAGPYTGNDVQTVFPFSFRVFATTDVKVLVADLEGAETTLSSGFTVTMNSDQVASPGGNVTLSAALATGHKLSVLGNLPNDQTLAIPGGGNFNPVAVENALDRLTMQLQQLAETAGRAVVVTATSGQEPATILSTLLGSASSAAASAASALASLNTFKSQYYGPLAADPTLDPLGAAVGAGDLYWNTAANELRTYTGSAWVYAPGLPGLNSVTLTRLAREGTAGQVLSSGGPGADPSYVTLTAQQPGEVCYFARSTAPDGFVKANGGTIGSAASGGTLRANADTSALFTLLWTEFSNSILPIQDSAGVTSTRGASAAADFAANKRLPVFDLRGEFVRGWDDGRGVDTGRGLSSAQTQGIQSHTHNVNYGLANTSVAATLGSSSGNTNVAATTSAGGTETRPRNVALLACIKL